MIIAGSEAWTKVLELAKLKASFAELPRLVSEKIEEAKAGHVIDSDL